MSLFKGIVKLTEEQYLTLKNGGTITNDLGTFTFDENVLYVTDTDFSQMKTKIVESLPEVGEINTIYMVLKEGSSTDYNRYMYINDRYTIIGETTINLAGYAKLDDIPTSLPASDVYEWAKQPTKPSYSVSELPNELLTTSKAEIGGNSVTNKLGFSVVRNTNGTVNQGLMSINDNGSVRVSHRNKSVNSNADDAYIDLSSEGMIVNGEEVAVKDDVYEFGKGVYEESSNLFNFPNIVIEKNGITYTVQDGIIHYKGTTSETQDSIVSVEFDTPIVLENDTVTVSLFNDLMSATNISITGLFDIGLGWDTNLVRTYENQTLTITKIYFYVSTNKTVDGYIRPVMVKGKKAVSKFIPYNPNRHITNGEAVFLKQEFENCKNKFDISRLVLVKGTIDNSNSTITLTSYANDSVNNLKDFTNLEVGKTYILTFNKTNAISNDYIYLAGSATQWINGAAHTITQAELDGVIIVYGRDEYTNVISELMISEHGGEYQPYNQNHHIANDEAYFLKEEFEKSKNKFDISRLTSRSDNFTVTNTSVVLQTNKFYCGPSTQTLKELANLEIGKSYVLSFNKTNASANNRIYLASVGVYWDNGSRLTITQAILDSKVSFYGTEDSTNTLSEIMISDNGGSYQPYNPSSHITNGQADLLKEHYTLSVNELNLNDTNKNLVNVDIIIKDEILNINGEKTEEAISYYFWDNNNSIVGKRKVKLFHFGGTTTATLQIIINRNNSNVQQFMFNGSKFSTENEAEVEFDGNERMFLYFGTGIRTATNLQIGITFSQYDIETFHSYKSGKIIHEKDITPVLLWENAVSSSSFSEQQIELISDDYEELEIEYLDYNLNYIEKRVFRADKSIILNGSLGWYVADNNLTLNFYSRYLTRLDSTHYNVNECVEILYKSTTDSPTIKVNNERLIPNRIWGRKMKL